MLFDERQVSLIPVTKRIPYVLAGKVGNDAKFCKIPLAILNNAIWSTDDGAHLLTLWVCVCVCVWGGGGGGGGGGGNVGNDAKFCKIPLAILNNAIWSTDDGAHLLTLWVCVCVCGGGGGGHFE